MEAHCFSVEWTNTVTAFPAAFYALCYMGETFGNK